MRYGQTLVRWILATWCALGFAVALGTLAFSLDSRVAAMVSRRLGYRDNFASPEWRAARSAADRLAAGSRDAAGRNARSGDARSGRVLRVSTDNRIFFYDLRYLRLPEKTVLLDPDAPAGPAAGTTGAEVSYHDGRWAVLKDSSR